MVSKRTRPSRSSTASGAAAADAALTYHDEGHNQVHRENVTGLDKVSDCWEQGPRGSVVKAIRPGGGCRNHPDVGVPQIVSGLELNPYASCTWLSSRTWSRRSRTACRSPSVSAHQSAA